MAHSREKEKGGGIAPAPSERLALTRLPLEAQADAELARRLQGGEHGTARRRLPGVQVRHAEQRLVPVVVVRRLLAVEQVEHVRQQDQLLVPDLERVVGVQVELRLERRARL